MIALYVVLSIPSVDENTLRSFSHNLKTTIEVHAISTAALDVQVVDNKHSQLTKELLESASTNTDSERLRVTSKRAPNGTSKGSYLFWKVNIKISTDDCPYFTEAKPPLTDL